MIKTYKTKGLVKLQYCSLVDKGLKFRPTVLKMDPSEIEFFAERQLINIIPKFTSNNVLHLISGDIGPFRAGLPVVVPLWIGVNLRQRQKCRIVSPDWMNIERLLEKKEEEKSSR